MFFILLLLVFIVVAGLVARAHFGSDRSMRTGGRSAPTGPLAAVSTDLEGGPRTSEVSRGEGWWLASDGNWYPPQNHPIGTAGSLSQPPAAEPSSHSSEGSSADRPPSARATARQCVNGHEMPESHVFCSICGGGKSDQLADFSAPHSEARTGLSQKIRAFYGSEGRLPPKFRIFLTAVIVVFVIGGVSIAASGGSSSSGSSSNSSSGGGSPSAPVQSPSEVCYSTLEGWATYFISTNDSSTIFEEFGMSSGIPMDVTEAGSGAQAAADQNGIQAGRDSMSSAITSDCTTLLGQGDDPTTWPTAPSS